MICGNIIRTHWSWKRRLSLLLPISFPIVYSPFPSWTILSAAPRRENFDCPFLHRHLRRRQARRGSSGVCVAHERGVTMRPPTHQFLPTCGLHPLVLSVRLPCRPQRRKVVREGYFTVIRSATSTKGCPFPPRTTARYRWPFLRRLPLVPLDRLPHQNLSPPSWRPLPLSPPSPPSRKSA